MTLREITIDDLKDKLDMKGSLLDVLAATAERAKEIYEATPPSAVVKISDEDDYRKRRKRPPLPLPEEFKKVIEERNATLVIQKELFGTDLSAGHNRLSIPINQITDDFLTEEEKRHLRGTHGGKKKNYLEVKMVQPSLEWETVKLCRWDMAKKKNGGKTRSWSYVINGNWNSIVEKNKLRVGMEVQLWCFRLHQHLCFALVRLPS